MDFEKDMLKFPYANLMLEATRKCNLKCEHCMRGEPQNINMSDEILEKVFEQTDWIYHLSLTGGEPFLAPNVIEKMVDIIIEKKVKVGRCTTVDNGTILNDVGIRCVKALNRLGDYIYNSVWDDEVRNNPDESLPISISISNSIYHRNDIQKAINFYKSYAGQHMDIRDQGDWETGLKDRKGIPLRYKDINSRGHLRKEGRAKENNLEHAKYIAGTYQVGVSMDKGTVYIDTGIQVCANGNVVLEEALSFESMDKTNMGNILEEPFSCMIYKWNWMEPLEYNEVNEYCKNMTVLENPNLSDSRRKDIESRNAYLDLKKYLLVEGHKDYPYLSYKDITTCVVAELALMMCEKFQDTGPGMSETEIIEKIISMELTGKYTVKLTKADLQRAIDYIVDKNFKKAAQEMNITDYLKYIIKLKANSKMQMDKLYNDKIERYVYEK